MVSVLEVQEAETPAGSPVAVPIPVAPVVVLVMAVRGVLIHKVGFEEAVPAELFGFTLIVPVALTEPHPPVKGIL